MKLKFMLSNIFASFLIRHSVSNAHAFAKSIFPRLRDSGFSALSGLSAKCMAARFFGSLMGLNMDLSMDAIAIRLGMWDWGKGFDYQYFGVPYNNFWAWFWVVFSFSASLRLLSKLPGFWGRWFSPAGAIICGTTGVLITNELITNIPNDLIHYATIIAVLVSALLLILALRPEISIRSQAAFVFLVPLGFHAYFLIAGLVSSVILDPPFLLAVSIVMNIIALGLHRDALNYWYRSNR